MYFASSRPSSCLCFLTHWIWTILLGGMSAIGAIAGDPTSNEELCTQLRSNTDKILAMGLIFESTLALVTTSGYLLQVDLNSALQQHEQFGYYTVNLTEADPPVRLQDKWPKLDLRESQSNVVIYFILNMRKKAYLGAVTKQKLADLEYGNQKFSCALFLDFNETKLGGGGRIVNGCNTNVQLDIMSEEFTSRTISADFFVADSTDLIEGDDSFGYGYGFYQKGDIIRRGDYFYKQSSEDIFRVSPKELTVSLFTSKAKDGLTPTVGFLLREPHNLLVYIYSDGSVEQRILDQEEYVWNFKAPTPEWSISTKDFFVCDDAQSQVSLHSNNNTSGIQSLISSKGSTFWIVIVVVALLVFALIGLAVWKSKSKSKKSFKNMFSRIPGFRITPKWSPHPIQASPAGSMANSTASAPGASGVSGTSSQDTGISTLSGTPTQAPFLRTSSPESTNSVSVFSTTSYDNSKFTNPNSYLTSTATNDSNFSPSIYSGMDPTSHVVVPEKKKKKMVSPKPAKPPTPKSSVVVSVNTTKAVSPKPPKVPPPKPSNVSSPKPSVVAASKPPKATPPKPSTTSSPKPPKPPKK